MISAQPKPVKRTTTKRKQHHTKALSVSEVRQAVFERDGYRCRVCYFLNGSCEYHRRATEMHELKFKSLGGKVTVENCIAVCGTHHRALHLHLLWPIGTNANLALSFVKEKPA